jgi:hypothetical protein
MKHTYDVTVPASMPIICPHCQALAIASVKGEVIVEYRYSPQTGEPLGLPTEKTFVQCSNCSEVLILAREDYGMGFEFDTPVIIFPAPRRLNAEVPESLRREWDEARICFEAKAYTATVVMMRRTLEAACKDQGVSNRNLSAALAELKTQSLIDETLAEWAHELRLLGNRGAHAMSGIITRDDAQDSLDFTETLLEQMYVLRKRFESFRIRRSKSKKELREPRRDGTP